MSRELLEALARLRASCQVRTHKAKPVVQPKRAYVAYKPSREVTLERRRLIRELLHAGRTVKEISGMTGISPKSVRKHLKRLDATRALERRLDPGR